MLPIRNSVDAAIGKQTDKNTSTQDEENMDTTTHVGAISADDVSDVESVTVQKEGPTNSLIQLKAPIGIKSMCSIIVCFVNKKRQVVKICAYCLNFYCYQFISALKL